MAVGMERAVIDVEAVPVCGPVESKRIPCASCGSPMEPEHAHYKCPACGYIEPCCGW
jgi:Zn finger protein HypA/HybF involved in hydrogenase expression